MLEKRAEEARATISEREVELERLADSQAVKEKAWEEKWKKEERMRREAEKRSEEFKDVVQRLTMAQGGDMDFSSAAAVASDQKASGKSYTQFYLDYTIQESKLRAAEDEVGRLTGLLDEISADIREKVGIFTSSRLQILTACRNLSLTNRLLNIRQQSSAQTLLRASSPWL